MSQTTELSPLIQTKLHRPRVAGDLIERTRLLAYLNERSDRPFTLISAPAGYGKTTLLTQWLDQAPYQAAWLSLDENDNDLIVFLSYFVATIQTLFPDACSTTQNLLTTAQTLPLDYLTTTLINELVDLPEEFLLVLDDYHLITHQEIQQLISTLMQHAPPPLHLVIASRKDPSFSLARPRATQKVAEIRMNDLRFTPDEVQSYLEICLGTDISPEVVTVLAERTEGWPVGLRLACLSLRDQENYAAFLETFQGTQQYIMEYLVDEILSHQPQPVQAFLLCTSILDRFCAPLGDALLEGMSISGEQEQLSGKEILAQLEKDNLFVVSLDQQGQWYRYHHLFKDLLFYKLTAETSKTHLAALHTAAATWLDENGFFEEAFEHALAVDDLDLAINLVETHNHEMMNQEQWPRLRRWLDQLPQQLIEQRVPLLLVKAWLLTISNKFGEVIPILEQVKAMLAQDTPDISREQRAIWGGEAAALWSIIFYWIGQGQSSLDNAIHALEITPPAHAFVIGNARNYQINAYQLLGQLDRAYQEIHQAQAEYGRYNDEFAARIELSRLMITILDGNLYSAEEASTQLVNLAQSRSLYEVGSWGHQTLGYIHYQWNDLEAAEHYFSKVLEFRYQSNPVAQTHSTFGLALTYRAQGRHNEAARLAENAIGWAKETGNAAMLLDAYSFASRLTLLNGQAPNTDYWAASLDNTFSVMLLVEIPYLTLAATLIARRTPAALKQATELLAQLHQFVEETHNTWRLIEVLSLQALLHNAQGDRQSALAELAQAIELAQPGGFIRLFVDLGSPMAGLLTELKPKGSNGQQYVNKILAAFEKDKSGKLKDGENVRPSVFSPQLLIEPLTNRELDVLELLTKRLTDKEIAERLTISPLTVKSHVSNMFGKLNVNNRRQAVNRARELRLLSSK
jgi:LuxR family maltose regulon positive regulatory protein